MGNNVYQIITDRIIAELEKDSDKFVFLGSYKETV